MAYIQGPIPLRDNQMQSPDQFEDVLRKMKTQQEITKLQQQTKEINDQKNLLEQREAVKRLMDKNSNKNFTYDYDGKIILSKKGSVKTVVNQENTVGILYKIGATTNVVKKQNQEKPQQVIQPKVIDSKQSKSRSSISSVQSKLPLQNDQIQAQQQNQPSTYDMMLENIRPSQGVIFKGSKGEIKAGEGYKNNQQSQFDFYDTSKNPNDIKRMTKKEYDEFIRNSGNYSRHDTFKRYSSSQNNIGSNYRSSENNNNNNIEDILDGINYSQIQPIEEQTEEQLNTQNDRRSQNNILQGVSPHISQNKSSFKMAGIQSIYRQSSEKPTYSSKQINNNLDFDNPKEIKKGYGYYENRPSLLKNQTQLQMPKKNKAGNIQVADQEKLRAMLLN